MTIPLQKWAQQEFPLTAKATIHLWATEGFFRNKGILAGRIQKIGGRWYVTVDRIEQKSVADNIVEKIVKLAKAS